MVFKDLESLKQYLQKDSSSATLNPVRFINVDSMSMWIEVKKVLLSLADETMPLSKYCEDSDTTPNIGRVSSVLKKATKSQFVCPLSEYLRIIPEQAEPVIKKFLKAEYQHNDNGRLRIYFLMYRMKSLLKTIKSDDPRDNNTIIFLETNEESDYKLTIVQKALQVHLPGNEINGFKSYLEYWEANPDKPLILHTNNAIHFEKNHFFDDVHVIVSSFDLLQYQFELPSNLIEEYGTEAEWNELAKYIIKEGSFKEACCSVFSINRFSSQLFKAWNANNSFKKWLLWLWQRAQTNNNSYLCTCASNCDSYLDLVDELYCGIINYIGETSFEQFYKERYAVLSDMQSVPTEMFWKKTSLLNNEKALMCMTCLTDIERKTIFELISNFDYSQKSTILPIVKKVYPKLYYYLHNDEQLNRAGLLNEHYTYFDEYKWLKATDTITDSFVERVKDIALEKGSSVFAMQSRNHYVTEHYDDKSLILFVDGMGIEYVDYLAYLFSDLNDEQYSVSFDAGFCTLPSVTEINKDFMNDRRTVEPPVRELDELKHSNNVHPESIIKQLSILDDLKSRVLGLLIGDVNKVIIAADHGTSRMAVKVRNTKFDNVLPKPEDTAVYKYGRFCEGTKDESLYPTAICINDRLVFADYTRFIQMGAPIDEIHGGASLEEWIVPIVTVEKYVAKKAQTVVVSPIMTAYKPELGTKRIIVEFTISGSIRNSVNARVKGRNYKCDYKDGIYSFSFVPDKEDTSLLVRIADHEILGQFNIQIEQGITKNSKFDI